MAVGDDRLSELPDDLLRRVLHFAPLKEAASTTALSRRWRAPLWLSSGGLNLETGVHDRNARAFSRLEDFVSAAVWALGAAPVTRLTLHLESDLDESVDEFLLFNDRDMDKVVSNYTDLIDVALSHRAARSVKELRVVAKDPDDYYLFDSWDCLYRLNVQTLPFDTLLVLELTNCKGLLYQRQAAAIVLPRLSSLRLSHCDQQLSSLQRIIDAAPALAAIRLEAIRIDATDEEGKEASTHRLRCPAVNVLVLDSCAWEEEKPGNKYTETVDVDRMKIDTPRLRCFRYKGPLRSFLFSPQPLELKQVNLKFPAHGNNGDIKDPDRHIETFWGFARNFTSTKEMKLKVNHLEDIAILNEARRVQLLPVFRRLQCLEVQGVNQTKDKAPAFTILNLLRCCPVLSALRINLKAKHHDDTQIPQKEIQIAALAPCHLLQCFQSSLRRVGLKFRLEKSNCLGVKLIKFFAENAMVLEEMYIDGGDENLCEDMNCIIGGEFCNGSRYW